MYSVPLVLRLWTALAQLEIVGMDSLLSMAFDQLDYLVDRTSFVDDSVQASPQGDKLLSGPPFAAGTYSQTRSPIWNVSPC